jgi:hypothetical protein
MLRRLFKQYTEVKPVHDDDGASGWIVFQGNALDCLFDDAVRYGWRVAWHNFKALLRD